MVAAAFSPVSVELRDGRRAMLRTITPQDKDALKAALQRLSPDSRYARFMTSLRELSPQMLESATHPESDRELALVAVVEQEAGGLIVGGARYAAAEGSEDCEFAVTIVDDWQGMGLARRLLEALMEGACARGFRRMEGYVLASNTPMRALAKRLGFADEPAPGDLTVRIVRRNLDAAA
jgi:RimJ/RimL family protein N-acetyltransferase